MNEKIYYTKSKTIEEEIKVEVDIDNCFFYSKINKFGNQPNLYRGHFVELSNGEVWINVIEFTNNYNKYTWNVDSYTTDSNVLRQNLKEFFERNPNFAVITKEEFMKKYNEIKAKL